jgi:leader peptidase (prepilin peptidase)/N-methyltransferase
MLIYRLPLNISLVNPKRSICPSCNHTIKWYENIPLISYIFLKGKCSKCKNNISIIYPIVELLTVIVTILIFIKLGLTSQFVLITTLFYLLIILSFIDLKYKAVPDYLLILILINAFFISNFSLKFTLIFAGASVLLELFITFYIQNIKYKFTKNELLKEQRAMGEGDIPILAIIGGLLGIKLGISAIFLASFLAIIPSLLNTIIKKDIETPFIPFLALGFFIIYTLENNIFNIFEGIIR